MGFLIGTPNLFPAIDSQRRDRLSKCRDAFSYTLQFAQRYRFYVQIFQRYESSFSVFYSFCDNQRDACNQKNLELEKKKSAKKCQPATGGSLQCDYKFTGIPVTPDCSFAWIRCRKLSEFFLGSAPENRTSPAVWRDSCCGTLENSSNLRKG